MIAIHRSIIALIASSDMIVAPLRMAAPRLYKGTTR